MTYLCSPITPPILDGIGRGHLQEIFFFFFLNHICSLFGGKYSRMQLFGYGVKKKPNPYTKPPDKIPRKYHKNPQKPVEPTKFRP
jgi:hypothetical protein